MKRKHEKHTRLETVRIREETVNQIFLLTRKKKKEKNGSKGQCETKNNWNALGLITFGKLAALILKIHIITT